jgi:hypothetical protein
LATGRTGQPDARARERIRLRKWFRVVVGVAIELLVELVPRLADLLALLPALPVPLVERRFSRVRPRETEHVVVPTERPT